VSQVLIQFPKSLGLVKLAATSSGVQISPQADFDLEDPANAEGLRGLLALVRNGSLTVGTEKIAVIAVPQGQEEQAVGTEPPADPQGPSVVPLSMFQQLQQQVQQLQQQVQQLISGGASPQPTQPWAAPQSAMSPSPTPQPQPGKVATLRGLSG